MWRVLCYQPSILLFTTALPSISRYNRVRGMIFHRLRDSSAQSERTDTGKLTARRTTMSLMHTPSCACCGDLLAGRFDRRAFLKAAGSAGVLAAFPFAALPAEGNYEAMVLSCIDPRFPEL